ncbi:energy transducer TonB [Candidatus Finniella inopinata]|uniref:Energy transducer TonB n=1 Tax=Candidatus Finniella inopinata TaxID=1696036 RepID=A0A4Q7DG92_9PROT|nr:energy transducer TonB [Candidatus Finniella inopinata]RZI45813.1 energy transducer TonB [Candidatus Finniella inopinata]
MKLNKALPISLLLHGLAFAGTGWIVSVGDFKGETANVSRPVCVEVQWITPSSLSCLPPESIPLSQETGCLPQPPKRLHPKKMPPQPGPCSLQENPEDGMANVVLVPFPNNPVPTYPEEARRQGLKGEMIVTLTINAAGLVVKIDVKQGNDIAPILKEAVFEAVKKWRFTRHDKSGKPLSVTLPIVFNLEA